MKSDRPEQEETMNHYVVTMENGQNFYVQAVDGAEAMAIADRSMAHTASLFTREA